MKNKISIFTLLLGFTAMLAACQSGDRKKAENLSPNAHEVKAEEVIQTSRYTYVRVSADNQDYWIAINKADVKEGETYYWSIGSEMKEFTSKEMKRTFRSIYFVQDFTDQPITETVQMPQSQQQMGEQQQMGGQQPAVERKGISVPKAEGGITIAELFSGKENFNGKKVRILGEVVKFTGGVMKKNWVHLQDGTRAGDKFDLAVTTQDSVKVGDIALFEGVVSLNKDFGAGYFYDVIVEDALLKQK
ncbi:MAG: GW dipeptide domain-containing protein [bacterium]